MEKKWKIVREVSGPVAYKKCLCAKCNALADIVCDGPSEEGSKYHFQKEEFTLYPKYNFCPNCRDKKSDIEPSDKKTKEVHKFASNGWIDASCMSCGYSENIDVGCYLGYHFCPNCGAEFVDPMNIILIPTFGEG